MQGVKEIASLIFWMDNTKHYILKDAMLNNRSITKEKQIILQHVPSFINVESERKTRNGFFPGENP